MYSHEAPKKIRKMIFNNEIAYQTSGMCLGYAQANLVILPKSIAFEFLLFANRNPKVCPILEVVENGEVFQISAKGEKISEVIPKYRLFREGVLEGEYSSVHSFWEDDFVTFVIGCSFTFEAALIEEGITMKHIQEGKNVAMYQTNIACKSAGSFQGDMVVSMRPIKMKDLEKVIEITSRYPSVHGAPVHVGSPEQIGITNIERVDYGDAILIGEDEVPVFWACGVTPQGLALSAKPRVMITHAPGHMLITDIKNSALAK